MSGGNNLSDDALLALLARHPALAVVQVGEQEENQTENEYGADPIESVERGKIKQKNLDHREPRDAESGNPDRLEGAAEPDDDQRGREHQPPGTDG